jgi:2-dehydropantoate 2-reductase
MVGGWQGEGVRWVVYGAGAVGGVLGARLHEAGHDVVLVARGEHRRAILERGLTLRTPDGARTLTVPTVGTAAELDLSEPALILLAVKSHQTHAAVEDLVAVAPATTPVVSLQNGVCNEPTLLRFFADVYGVCVMMPTAHLEPGVVEQQSHPVPGILDAGRYPSGVDATTRVVAEAVGSAGFVSEPREDIMAWKHRKLLANLANAVQACCGPGPAADELTARAREEGAAVLHRAGVAVVSEEQDRERRGDILRSGGAGGRSGGSSWQSLRRGTGSIESDYLNGEIVLLGRLHGEPTPCNELLRRTAVAMAREGAAAGSLDAAQLLSRLG